MSNQPMNFREHPEQYDINAPDDEALRAEPYALEVTPRLRVGSTDEAAESAADLYELYVRYKETGDFVGMDVVRRALRQGLARAKQAQKRETATCGGALRPPPAAIFSKTYRMVDNDPDFLAMKAQHIAAFRGA